MGNKIVIGTLLLIILSEIAKMNYCQHCDSLGIIVNPTYADVILLVHEMIDNVAEFFKSPFGLTSITLLVWKQSRILAKASNIGVTQMTSWLDLKKYAPCNPDSMNITLTDVYSSSISKNRCAKRELNMCTILCKRLQ